MQINLGDSVTTKKAHPCGSKDWTVVRTGADIKLKCLKCGRIVLFSHDEFSKIIKSIGGNNNGE